MPSAFKIVLDGPGTVNPHGQKAGKVRIFLKAHVPLLFVKQPCGGDSQRLGERDYVVQADVALPALEAREVGAVHACSLSKLFLGESLSFSQLAYATSKGHASRSNFELTLRHNVDHATRPPMKGLQTMSNIASVPEELVVGRGDPAYMAHAYLTKVPVPAIIPFLEAYTRPGEVVLDPFAGSGMTGVAAAASGRRARLFDISVLGRHIGRNYVNFVDGHLLLKEGEEIIARVRRRLGDIYGVNCAFCNDRAELAKTVWSFVFECRVCRSPFNYYDVFKSAKWRKVEMKCPACSSAVSSRSKRIGEMPVLDYIDCRCNRTQIEQSPSHPRPDIDIESFDYPKVEISPDRQMYQASALGKSGLTTIASFYSPRNLAVLTVLRDAIRQVPDDAIRDKLLFVFTAILTRASKRYQWSPQRPLNAANSNYYVAPVYYEWNVLDLFRRKLESVRRSDEWIQMQMTSGSLLESRERPTVDVTYSLGSADQIHLPDDSVDYIFTDPPFGSNLYYADMALFQEAWLGEFSDVTQEAVIDRKGSRSASRYEGLLTAALKECKRVLKPGRYLSMVFGNSSGKIWAIVQRSIRNAGLKIIPEALVILNKGQRSVKGLASGFEHVATLDLILTMTADDVATQDDLVHVSEHEVARTTLELAAANPRSTPSHLYLELLRRGIRDGWMLDELDLRTVTTTLLAGGWEVDPKTGILTRM
jgi:DNA modification methylase